MYSIEFLKKLFKMKNWGIITYLGMNLLLFMAPFVISAIGSYESDYQVINLLLSMVFGISLYLVSISIALSPFGEWILRKLVGCNEIKRKDYIDRLRPLFHEVYGRAQIMDPTLSPDIKLYMNEDIEPNAFATGRNTICLTRGLLNYSDEEIKAVFAHEFGHLHNKDTDALLIITVGNLIISMSFLITRVMFTIAKYCVAIFSRRLGPLILTFFMEIIFIGMFNLWTWIGTMLVLQSSRAHEFEADKFAFDLGYGYDLVEALDHLSEYSGERSKGLFATLMSSHPSTDLRISKLQELGISYGRY